ncbi:MAG: exosortase/archaeosortase family protein [Planctomycetota bacterium]
MTRTSWFELSTHNYIKTLIVGGLLYYLFHNEIYSIVHRWVEDPSWSHGFLIPLFSLYFINQCKKEILSLEHVGDPLVALLCGCRPDRIRPGQTRASYLGLLLLIFVFLFYIFNLVSPAGYAYFRLLSVIAALGAIVLFLGGWGLVKYTWLPISFLVFAVPLPARFYFSLTTPMRRWAATTASALLDATTKMSFEARGVVICIFDSVQQEWKPALDVADACSGMRLLLAFLALGVAMAYLHYRPLWQRLILLASTIPTAIFCNIVRVTATGFIYILVDPKYTQGIYHDLLGMAMLPLAFGLYGLLAWFMASLFVEESDGFVEDIVVRRKDA